jgi:hypothetical protein
MAAPTTGRSLRPVRSPGRPFASGGSGAAHPRAGSKCDCHRPGLGPRSIVSRRARGFRGPSWCGWPTARTTAAAMWPSLARSWSTRPTVHCLVSLVPYRSWPAMCQARMMQGCISLPVSNEIYVGRPTRHPPDPGELAERSSGSTNWRPSSASRARLSWPGFRRWENSSARLPRPSSTSLPGSSENSSRRRPSASLVRQASCAPANRLGRPHRV